MSTTSMTFTVDLDEHDTITEALVEVRAKIDQRIAEYTGTAVEVEAETQRDGEPSDELAPEVITAIERATPRRQPEMRRFASRIQGEYGVTLSPSQSARGARVWMHAPGARTRRSLGYIDPSRVTLSLPPEYADGYDWVDPTEHSGPGGSVSVKVGKGGTGAEKELWELLPIAIRLAQEGRQW